MPMTVLALLPEAATARRCLQVAWAAASVANGELEAFHVMVDPSKLVTADEEISLQRLRVRQEGTAQERAAAVRAIYDEWRAALSGAEQVSWREVVGAEEAAVALETQHADLVVFPAPHNLDSGDAFHAALRKSHRPLLFVSDTVSQTRFTHHLAIAWKPTPQARRAVEGAGVWLRAAQRVSLIMVAETPQAGGWDEAERLCRQLGFIAEPVLLAPTAQKVGERLLGAAKALDANAMVLGAYRHNDVVEWVLPSTTRYLLHHADLPLFLAH